MKTKQKATNSTFSNKCVAFKPVAWSFKKIHTTFPFYPNAYLIVLPNIHVSPYTDRYYLVVDCDVIKLAYIKPNKSFLLLVL